MDMANTLTEAYKVYKSAKAYPDAARVLQQAIKHYTTTGNFRRAATHQQNLAELYEQFYEPPDNAAALAAYETAANWFESDNAAALANKLYLKVGELAALEGDFPRAIAKFEAVAKSSIDSNLMKWSVKEYFLKAGICRLAVGDIIATRRALQGYKEMDNSFAAQRECMLLNDLLQCQEDGEPAQFSEKLWHYDTLSPLDKWKTAILVKVKEGIAKADEEEDFS
jgi:alpha-soluble NSF attachment protein